MLKRSDIRYRFTSAFWWNPQKFEPQKPFSCSFLRERPGTPFSFDKTSIGSQRHCGSQGPLPSPSQRCQPAISGRSPVLCGQQDLLALNMWYHVVPRYSNSYGELHQFHLLNGHLFSGISVCPMVYESMIVLPMKTSPFWLPSLDLNMLEDGVASSRNTVPTEDNKSREKRENLNNRKKHSGT